MESSVDPRTSVDFWGVGNSAVVSGENVKSTFESKNFKNVSLLLNGKIKYMVKGKGKGFPYWIPSVGPGADPGVQAVSPQVTVSHPPGGIGCHYFPPGLRLPPQPQSITALWPVPSYTAWWQMPIGVNNLPKVVKPRLHDTTCCQTRLTTGLTTGCIV